MAKVSIHNLKDYLNLTEDLKLLNNTPTIEKQEIQIKQNESEEKNSKGCKVCNNKFTSRNDQVRHYKSDWHRYNLKNNLLNRKSISFEEFEDMIDDLSSISGSDSDTSEDDNNISKSPKPKYLQKDISQSKNLNLNEEKVSQNDTSRSPFVFFKNSKGKTIMVYKSIFSSNEEHDYIHELNSLTSTSKTATCVILFNAGHFAATVFELGEAIIHKTFHKYVVRAKRGTVQSQRDQKGSAPKSGGASLRRHNESELAKNIQTLLADWKERYLNSCKRIFIRSPKYNKAIFYGGKEPIFGKNDDRIKGIPFSTKRPTFNETKRVYQEIFSLKIYEEDHEISLLISPIKNSSPITSIVTGISEVESIETANSNSFDNQINNENDQVATKNLTIPKELEVQPPNTKIETIESDCRKTSDTCMREVLLDNLYTACKSGNVQSLLSLLSALTDEDKNYLGSNFNIKIDNALNTLLHVAAKSGKTDIIYELLKAGCDPCLKNLDNLTPYSVSCDKPTRNSFRRFMASYPEKYDYVKANIPGPLTEEMENEMKAKQNLKKKAKQKSRKEKQKVKAQEKEIERLENDAKQKFSSLSDREKRALAAEKRIASQAKEKGEIPTLSSDRCWKCGESLLGKIPFEYSTFKFCSLSCLKLHKGIKT